MKLYAISDLHVGHADNHAALVGLSAHPEDWLILAGDLGETEAHMRFVLELATERFARVFWTPGNHELWGVGPVGRVEASAGGVARYDSLVALCRSYDVHTPEDPYVAWPGSGESTLVAPVFILYDGTFAPAGVGDLRVWASRGGVACADDRYLDPAPHASVAQWCAARLQYTEARLAALPDDVSVVLVNHFPLRRDLVRFVRLSRFGPWCGSRGTESWLRRFPISVVVSGHLHMRSTDWRGNVRFEEVSLGYPRHWDGSRHIDAYLREILPGPSRKLGGGPGAGPRWVR